MAKAIILAVIPQGRWQFRRVTTSMQKGEALLPKRLQYDLFIMCDTYSDCSIYLKLNYLFSYLFRPTGAPFFKLQGKTSTTHFFLSRWHNSHSRSLKQYQVSMQLKSAKKTVQRKTHNSPTCQSTPMSQVALFKYQLYFPSHLPPTHLLGRSPSLPPSSVKKTPCVYLVSFNDHTFKISMTLLQKICTHPWYIH